jgi:hypothetical protein
MELKKLQGHIVGKNNLPPYTVAVRPKARNVITRSGIMCSNPTITTDNCSGPFCVFVMLRRQRPIDELIIRARSLASFEKKISVA